GYFFNIQGRVCLEGLLVFGFGCVAVIYFLAPLLDNWLSRIPPRVRYAIVIVLSVGFLTDLAFAWMFPRTGRGITW
ncbi:MAG: putative ABC transporter permease, partial [Propionibacteriaceae bacterium]|nr:putative ABC transporter permease [Propionibacteriaceae bacterium]